MNLQCKLLLVHAKLCAAKHNLNLTKIFSFTFSEVPLGSTSAGREHTDVALVWHLVECLPATFVASGHSPGLGL